MIPMKQTREWAGVGKFLTHVKVGKKMTVDEMIRELGNAGFQARKLSKAVDILEEMIEDKNCTKFLGLGGTMVPGGMKNIIGETLKRRWTDVVISTGANVTHDLIEAFGEKHMFMDSEVTDVELQKRGINRIYNILLPNRGYVTLEENLRKLLPKLPQKEMSSREFLFELGKKIKDKDSFVKIAAEKNIPIFVPSISDSVLGFHVWMYSQDHKLTVNTTLDQGEILDITFGSKKTGALIVGGGVPKHYIAMANQISDRPLWYAIQITMDRPEGGGVSGARLEEAKSWRKVHPKAETVDLICDGTIALPLIFSALVERLNRTSNRKI